MSFNNPGGEIYIKKVDEVLTNLSLSNMANQVIKKDGSRQPFDPEKIKNSVASAAARTDLSEERKNEVVEQVVAAALQMAEGREEIATSEIKGKILGDLDQIEPKISESWSRYDRQNKE